VHTRIAVLLIAVSMVPRVIGAQAVAPGARVRVTHPGEGARLATMVALTADSLVVRWAGGSDTGRMALEQVTRLDVSRGMQRRNPAPRSGVGFLVGASIGLVAGASSGSDCPSTGMICMSAGDAAVLVGGALGVVGAVIGAASGIGRSEKWERVKVEAPRLTLVAPPRGQGRGVGLAVAF